MTRTPHRPGSHRWTLPLALCGALVLVGHDGRAAHPTGEVDARHAARQGVQVDDGKVSCFDCHVAHGATLPGMLTAPATVDGCLSCHVGVAGGRGRNDRGAHPWGVPAPSARAAAAMRAAGWSLGPDDTIGCLSCHAAHREVTPTGSCATCHGGQARGGAHDRVSCLDCHTVHPGVGNLAGRRAQEGDSEGCLACHAAGRQAHEAGVTPGALGHPVAGARLDSGELVDCTTCHDAHGPPPTASTQGCGECHADQAGALARGGHGDADCMDCHPVHAASPMETSLALDEALNPRTRACLGCHGAGGKAEAIEAYEHPTPVFDLQGKRWQPLGGLPLYAEDGTMLAEGEMGDLTCSSCHLTHGPEGEHGKDSLRREGWKQACASCHGNDALPLYRYFHQPARRDHIEVTGSR